MTRESHALTLDEKVQDAACKQFCLLLLMCVFFVRTTHHQLINCCDESFTKCPTPLHAHTHTHCCCVCVWSSPWCIVVLFSGHKPITLAKMKDPCFAPSKACTNGLGHCLLWRFNKHTHRLSGAIPDRRDQREGEPKRAAPALAVSQGGLPVCFSATF